MNPKSRFRALLDLPAFKEIAEVIEDDKLVLIEAPQHVSVMAHDHELRAAISADNLGSHWWLARAIVNPPDLRGMGIGTLMLKKLLPAIVRQGCLELRVTPGGYEGLTEKQFNFYLKNGFERTADRALLVWRPPQ